MSNKELIEKFYKAFQSKNGKEMSECYHSEIVFSDAVFGELRGEQPGYMWQMLTSQAKDLEISFDNIEASEDKGSADWIATYTFSKTGKFVKNVVSARFKFKDGKIVEHRDSFDFYTWSRQAFGIVGVLLGWSKGFQAKVSKVALKGLEIYQSKQK